MTASVQVLMQPGELPLELVDLVEELRAPWRAHAACRGEDQATFFPQRGEADLVAKARAMCAECPVAAECLAYARTHEISGQEFGVWGGASALQRRRHRGRPLRVGSTGATIPATRFPDAGLSRPRPTRRVASID